MSEEAEAIMRLIADLRSKIKSAKDKIAYLRAEEKLKRTEYEVAPISEKWRIRRELAVTWGAIGGFTRWMRYWEARIRELEKVIPPHRFLRYRITFSITTGGGHEPFFAEVTCDTVVGKEVALDEFKTRLVNAVVKLFWVLFDVQKSLFDLESAGYKGTETYDWIVGHKEIIQKYSEPPAIILETILDELLTRIIELDALSRDPAQYVTTEAIIKIGVEPPLPMPDDAEPKYPLVHILVEKSKRKGEPPTWVIERMLKIAKETGVNILKILEIELE